MWEELDSEGLESFRLGVREAVTGPFGKARDQSKVQEEHKTALEASLLGL